MKNISTTSRYVTVAFCAALNASLGFLVYYLKLPIYLDLVGTFIAARCLGFSLSCLTAVAGICLLGVLTTPTAFAYMGTGLILACSASWFVRFGYLKGWIQTIGFGLILGLISATVSAPVTTFLFGGVSFVGADAITAFFKATGKTLWTSVFLGGITTDLIDKVSASSIAYIIILSLPETLRKQLLPTPKEL